MLEQINGRLLTIENTVGDMERGLNSMTADLQKVKTDLDLKADNATVEVLKDEIEELQNRSRRNNLVFYNIPEKAEGGDCISFIQDFIMQHMGLETLCGHVELERAHRTPSKTPSVAEKGRPRPMHVAFLRYTDKMKVLRNAAARLKDNPLNGNVIGISEDFAKKNPKTEARARALQKVSEEETRCRPESLHWIPCNTEICRRKWPSQNRRNRRTSKITP